jgi:hypothetical protein
VNCSRSVATLAPTVVVWGSFCGVGEAENMKLGKGIQERSLKIVIKEN